jgi:hypothetical protein
MPSIRSSPAPGIAAAVTDSDHRFNGRSGSAWAKYVLGLFRI